MTQSDACSNHECNRLDSETPIKIDPLSFFRYASFSKDRWQELIGLTINHCTFGLGTIKKIDGEYIYIDLPQRQGKKQLTEFGLDSFRRGFFNNLEVNNALQQKILAPVEASPEMPSQSATIEAETPQEPAKKKRKYTKTTKKQG